MCFISAFNLLKKGLKKIIQAVDKINVMFKNPKSQ